MFKFRIIATLAACLILSSCVHAAPKMSGGIDDFSAIVEISRLPPAQQAPKIAQLYEWLPALYAASLNRRSFTELPPQLTPAEKQLSAQEQIMLAYPRGSWQRYVDSESYDLASEILHAHPDEVAALLLEDLRADDEKYQKRGLFNLSKAWPLIYRHNNSQIKTAPSPIRARWFEPIYAEVARLFQRSPQVAAADFNSTLYSTNYYMAPVKALAEEALTQLGDARAIALFINDNAAQPAHYYLTIRGLTSEYPNDTGLQPLEKLLISGDAELRYHALFALPAKNRAVRAALPVLLGDADAKIRALAVLRAFELKEPEFEKAQLKPD